MILNANIFEVRINFIKEKYKISYYESKNSINRIGLKHNELCRN